MSPSRAGSLAHHLVYTGLDIYVLCKNHSDLNGLSGLYQWVAFASSPTLGQPPNLDVSPGVKLVPVANLRPSVLCVRSPEAHLTWDWEVIRSGPNSAGSTVSVWEGTGSLTSLSC